MQFVSDVRSADARGEVHRLRVTLDDVGRDSLRHQIRNALGPEDLCQRQYTSCLLLLKPKYVKVYASDLTQTLALDDAFNCNRINVHAHQWVAFAEIPEKSAHAKAFDHSLDDTVQFGIRT